MSYEKLIIDLAKSTLGEDDDVIKAIIYEDPEADEPILRKDAAKQLIAKDATRIKVIKEEAGGDRKKSFDDGAKKERATLLGKIDQSLVDKGYKGEKKGLEGVMDFVQIAQDGKLADPDKIKTSPTFIETEKKLIKEKEDALALKDEEFAKFKSSVDRDKTMNVVKDIGLQVFRKQKPVLSENPEVAANQEKSFLTVLDGMDFKVDGKPDNPTILIMDGDKRLETENGHPVEFESFIVDKTKERFDLKTQDSKNNLNLKDKIKVGNAEISLDGVKVPKTIEERNQMINEAKGDNKKIVQINEAWKRSPNYKK